MCDCHRHHNATAVSKSIATSGQAVQTVETKAVSLSVSTLFHLANDYPTVKHTPKGRLLVHKLNQLYDGGGQLRDLSCTAVRRSDTVESLVQWLSSKWHRVGRLGTTHAQAPEHAATGWSYFSNPRFTRRLLSASVNRSGFQWHAVSPRVRDATLARHNSPTTTTVDRFK